MRLIIKQVYQHQLWVICASRDPEGKLLGLTEVQHARISKRWEALDRDYRVPPKILSLTCMDPKFSSRQIDLKNECLFAIRISKEPLTKWRVVRKWRIFNWVDAKTFILPLYEATRRNPECGIAQNQLFKIKKKRP